MIVRKMTSTGRVTIPSQLRKKFRFNPGKRIVFIEKNGKLTLQLLDKKYFDEIAGILDLKGKMLKSLINEDRDIKGNKKD